MKRVVVGVILSVAVVVFAVDSSPAKEPKPFGFAASGGYGSYAMSDVNDAISTPGVVFPGATTTADEITGGAHFGLGFRVWPSDRFKFGFDVTRLLGSTSGSAVYLGTPYEGELSTDGTAFTATGTVLVASGAKVNVGLGGGAGYYVATGDATVTGGGSTLVGDVTGSGFGFHARLEADVKLTRRLHTELGAGYRYAKTTTLEVGGGQVTNADGSDATVDWSGVTGTAGLVLYIGSRLPRESASP